MEGIHRIALHGLYTPRACRCAIPTPQKANISIQHFKHQRACVWPRAHQVLGKGTTHLDAPIARKPIHTKYDRGSQNSARHSDEYRKTLAEPSSEVCAAVKMLGTSEMMGTWRTCNCPTLALHLVVVVQTMVVVLEGARIAMHCLKNCKPPKVGGQNGGTRGTLVGCQ